ncbi:MAG: DeoR/GlpR transcriptional regulator [Anaerolineae bacterium]|nr:DeoR/GlpR transcriptional regulator [Anaerolineae bacterium]
MLAAERQKIILDVLARNHSVEVVELAIDFKVSEMTIRRDLLKLEQAGLLRRTFGGAVSVSSPLALQMSVIEKESVHQQDKIAIGLAAAQLIRDGETVGIGAGTTCAQVGKHLCEDRSITVVTNALNIASDLAHRRCVQLMVTGGTVVERSLALVGPFAEAIFDQVHINKLFLGATGVTYDQGVTTQDLMEASLYKAMISAAQEVIIVADSSKLGLVTFAPMVRIEYVTKLVVDAQASEEYLEKINRMGVEIIIAKE